MTHKHIDPEPDRRYLIKRIDYNCVESAVVVDSTGEYIRLKWDDDGCTRWYSFNDFHPRNIDGSYWKFQILQQLESE